MIIHLKSIYIIIFFFIINTLSLVAEDFSEYGIFLKSQKTLNKDIIYNFEDSFQIPFTIIINEPLDKEKVEQIEILQNIFNNWSYLKPASVTYAFYDNEIEINIIPEEFRYMDFNLHKYIKSGLQFYHDTITRFNFRIEVNNKYPKVKGNYFSEEDLCKEIINIIEIANTPLKEKQDYDSLACNTTKLQDKIETLKKDFIQLENKYQNLQSKLDALEKENIYLKENLEILRQGVLIINNQGIFGNINAIPHTGINRIFELKKEKPNILQEEVAEILKAEDIDMNSHEIFLVFSLYFNEFN